MFGLTDCCWESVPEEYLQPSLTSTVERVDGYDRPPFQNRCPLKSSMKIRNTFMTKKHSQPLKRPQRVLYRIKRNTKKKILYRILKKKK